MHNNFIITIIIMDDDMNVVGEHRYFKDVDVDKYDGQDYVVVTAQRVTGVRRTYQGYADMVVDEHCGATHELVNHSVTSYSISYTQLTMGARIL